MTDIVIHEINNTNCRVVVNEQSISYELNEFFSFKIPDYFFMKKKNDKRLKYWDGTIRLFKRRRGVIYKGLIPYIEVFAKQRGYTYECLIKDKTRNVTEEEIKDFLKEIKIKFEPRYYQLDNILHCINERRTLILSPTASGKSFSIYAVCRFLNRKTLLIVPTTHLVDQMYKDFEDYAEKDNTWKIDDECSKIMGGYSKEGLNQIVISTWQSIYNMDAEWFEQFQLNIVDEAHEAKAKSITTVMENSINAADRFGFTGTLDDLPVNKLVLEGLFGPVRSIVTTKELIDKKIIANLSIKCLIFNYNEKEKIKRTYQEEIQYLVAHDRRNKYIKHLSYMTKGNTLILYQFVEKHGDILIEMIKKDAEKSGKEVFYIHGTIKTEEREKIRQQVESMDNAIIVASYGTYQRGVNIVNLHNIIFASPAKSRIRNLQSIGRGLRRGEDKDRCVVFDLSDNLSKKSTKTLNYSLKHAYHRINIYNEQQFDYTLHKVNLNE